MKRYLPRKARLAPLDLRDALLLAVGLALLSAVFFRLAAGRQIWSDEAFGWVMVSDPSLTHMLHAWNLGADGGGAIFYLIARGWLHVFRHSLLAFRLLNAFGFALALVFAYITARRWYRTEIVAFTCAFLWFTAYSVLHQLIIARFYGVLTATVAATLLFVSRTLDTKRVRAHHLAYVFALNGLLVGVHPFGVLYSASLLCAIAAVDLSRRQRRLAFYLAWVAGWLILLPSRFALRASAAVGKPHFWTVTPTSADLISALAFWSDEVLWLTLFLVFVLLVITVLRRLGRIAPAPLANDSSALWLGAALLATIPCVWLVSLGTTSFFVDRYLLPTILGATLLFCALLHRLIPAQRSTRLNLITTAAVTAAFGGAIYITFFDVPANTVLPPHEYTVALANAVPPNLPLVIQRVDIFAETVVTQPQVPARYLLDSPIVFLSASPRGEVSGLHEMENWQRSGYFSPNIQPSVTFLDQTTDFLVLNSSADLWFTHRIQSDPTFTVHKLATLSREVESLTLFRVHRKASAPLSQLILP